MDDEPEVSDAAAMSKALLGRVHDGIVSGLRSLLDQAEAIEAGSWTDALFWQMKALAYREIAKQAVAAAVVADEQVTIMRSAKEPPHAR